MKQLIISGLALLIAAQVNAETNTAKETPYGENPNIFKVLAHKTTNAIQNTANKIGEVTEKGIEEIRPKVGSTWQNTKTYTEEQATIAKQNTQKGIEAANQKIQTVKENLSGSSTVLVPIERGQLSQSSTTAQNPSPVPNIPTYSTAPAASVASAGEPVSTSSNSAANADQNVEDAGEIKRQSLPIQPEYSDSTTKVE